MVLSQCFSVRSLAGIVTAAGAAALLAGCGGSQSGFAPQALTQSNPAGVKAAAAIEPDANCRSHGGVHATPCRVVVTASNPDVTVTLRTPKGSKGSVVEHDTCGGASGIASISGSGDSWQVSAGAMQGTCRAHFNYFNNAKKVGWVKIKIQNQ